MRRKLRTIALVGAFLSKSDEELVLRLDTGRERERRHLVLLRELDRTLFGDPQSVLEHVLSLRERRRHLRRTLEVEAFVVAHPIVVGEILAESDAE